MVFHVSTAPRVIWAGKELVDMARKPRQVRELRVVLDTNALYTQAAHDLVNHETAEMIKGNNAHPDLKINWYLPATVIEERSFQMREKASGLIPSLAKMERLLGHRFGITPESLELHVQLAINSQTESLGIKVVDLNVDSVDWRKVIDAAHKRKAPFQQGDKEKGFRDALILETYIQLVAESPRTPSVCRLVLVTSDELLASAARDRVIDYNNAQVLLSLDELKNLINTLASQVDEAFLNELQEKARLMFFSSSDNKEALYYKEKIYDKIINEHGQPLEMLPDGAEFREPDGVSVVFPRFVKKEGQRIFWITRLRFKTKAYRFEDSQLQASLLANLPEPDTLTRSRMGSGLLSFGDEFQKYSRKEKRLVKSGATIFEVNWSTTVDSKRKLSRPEIQEVVFSETIWD